MVADTATVKLMSIRKEDKNFLNEMLKNIIDRKILEQGFRDYDRPMDRKEDVMNVVRKDE